MNVCSRVCRFSGLVAVLIAADLGADDERIEFFRSNFIPEIVTVEVGDRVSFQWVLGEHTVTSGRGPEDPEAGVLFDVLLVEETPLFSLEIGVEHVDGVSFFDRRHPDRMGFIEVSGGEATVRVAVVDNVFIPEEVFIFAGDSVKWEHEFMEDFHTVTSGLSSRPEDNPGALFDVESSCARPIFVYRFESPDTYPYFCRPHETMGMTGKVHVQDLFIRGDATGDESVDISDAIVTLNFLFLGRTARPCLDAFDTNDDGTVNISDAIFTLTFLFLGDAEMPKPYPLAGGDRTEDGLLCMEPPKEKD